MSKLWSIAVVTSIMVVGAGCKKEEAKSSAAPTGAPSGAAPSGAVPGPAVAEDPEEAEAAQAAVPSTGGGGGDGCDAAINRFYELNAAQGTPVAEESRPKDLAQCREQQWPPALTECMRTMTSPADLAAVCFKKMFDGASVDLKPGRTFDALALANGQYADVTPPPLTVDGDHLTGGSCESIMKVRGPAQASFVLCGGQVVAGPLTTVAEIKGVWAQINQANQDAYQLGRNIRANWPTGCSNCRYRVYDGNGNYLRDE